MRFVRGSFFWKRKLYLSIKLEWDNLSERRCWIIEKARPMDEVNKEATAEGRTKHIGSMLELCNLKPNRLWEACAHVGALLLGELHFTLQQLKGIISLSRLCLGKVLLFTVAIDMAILLFTMPLPTS